MLAVQKTREYFDAMRDWLQVYPVSRAVCEYVRGSPDPLNGSLSWYVIVAGETVGPLDTRTVLDRLERGALGEHPWIWRDGFSQWRPLERVPEFAETHAAWLRGERPFARLDVPDTTQLSTHVDLPACGKVIRTPPPAPVPQATPRVRRLTADRHEDSVLFSLAALQQQAAAPATAPAYDEELPVTSPAALSVPAPADALPAAPPQSHAHFGLYVMAFLLMAAVAGLTGAVILRDTEPVVAAKQAPAPRHSAASMSRHEAPPPAPEPLPPPPEATELPIPPPPFVPDKPEPAMIKAVMGTVGAAARTCLADPGGKVEVELSVAGKRGTVISAIPRAPHHDDELGHCVAEALRGATFPPFRRPSLDLLYTVRL